MGEAAKLFTRSLMMGLDSAVRKNEFAELTAEDVENLPYAEAVEYLKKRDVIKKVDYNKLSDKMRFRAFTASRIADGDLLKRINSELIKNVNDGNGLKDFLSLTKTDILNKVGMGAGGQGWYWETVYRTNVQTAYNTGRMMGFEEDKPLALHFVGIEDARQTDVCHSLSNVIRPYDDPLWEKYIPPLHFGCRSTVRAIYDEDELPEEWSSLEGIEKPAKGFGTNPLENDSWWNELSSQVARAKEYGVQGEIEAAKEILISKESGASTGGILDKSSDEQEAYAKRAYEEIRKKNAKSDIAKVAKSSGLSKKEVEKVRNHLFFEKHNLDKGFVRFDESAEIANAWEALEQGRPSNLDIILIKHELEELTIMEKYGYDYKVAHLMANKKYPWEYLKKGGWTDDNIQAEIERQLKELL
ncbi:MAG: minor capsid protein [Treponema sp.]|nr:minor capsid protein [Treponema sp.]